MNAREVVTRYYELANAGDWDAWCDLFAADQVMDEQLAGHIEGRETLREMMKGFPGMYASFSNPPKHFIVDGDQAAVSRTSPRRHRRAATVEAEVMNYFRITGRAHRLHGQLPRHACPSAPSYRLRERVSGMEEFDYVIVGAGTAGSVLAHRLSEDPDVRVLRAGGRRQLRSRPMWTSRRCGSRCWAARSTGATRPCPQPGLDGRVIYEPRGKLPGGSSNLYIMMHVRGHLSDFDNWAYQGAAGWSYGDLPPYFAKLEAQEDQTDPRIGTNGPQKVTFAGGTRCEPDVAGVHRGLPRAGPHARSPDFNGPEMIGTGWHHIDVKDGVRQGALEVLPGTGPEPAQPDAAHQCRGRRAWSSRAPGASA